LTSLADCIKNIAHTIVHIRVRLISAVPHHRAVPGYCDCDTALWVGTIWCHETSAYQFICYNWSW